MKSFKGKPLRNILTIFSRKHKTWQRCGLFRSYLFAEWRWRSARCCVTTLWIFAKTTRLLLKMNLNKCLAPWIASRLPLAVTLKKLNELRKWKQFQGNRWRDPDKKKGAEKEKRGTILFQKMEERIQTILEAAGRADNELGQQEIPLPSRRNSQHEERPKIKGSDIERPLAYWQCP